MKIGIVGAGKVGAACSLAMVGRGSVREIVIVDRTQHGRLCCSGRHLPGDDHSRHPQEDRWHRRAQRSVRATAAPGEECGDFRELVPRVVREAPAAVILVVSNPPAPLVDIARSCARYDRVLSTGTFLDSLRSTRISPGISRSVSPTWKRR